MKKTIFPILFSVALAFTFLSTPALAEGELEAMRAAGRLRIGVYTETPPFGYINQRNRLNGYDIFLARRLAKDLLGTEDSLTFVPVTPSTRLEALEKDQVDIILANFTVTPERAERVDFASPYMKVSMAVISPEYAPVANVGQLNNHRLIVTESSTAEQYFTENCPGVQLLKYSAHNQAFRALLDGRGVALANDNNLLYAWMKEHPGFVVELDSLGGVSHIAPAVQKGNIEFLEWLNDEIAMLERTGFFQQAYDQTLRPAFDESVDPKNVLMGLEEEDTKKGNPPLQW